MTSHNHGDWLPEPDPSGLGNVAETIAGLPEGSHRRAVRCDGVSMMSGGVRIACGVLSVALVALGGSVSPARSATLPQTVVDAVHGSVVGWAKSGTDWFVVDLTGRRGGWCGLDGAAWHVSLVQTKRLSPRVVSERPIGGAMCGNSLAWVRAGRFSDGRHQEAAFMLWTTPSIGAWTYIYRLDGGRLDLLARFAGDSVTLGSGTVTVGFENRGRSRHGELRDVYRFSGGRYRLVGRH